MNADVEAPSERRAFHTRVAIKIAADEAEISANAENRLADAPSRWHRAADLPISPSGAGPNWS
jgi:hypothetical protein